MLPKKGEVAVIVPLILTVILSIYNLIFSVKFNFKIKNEANSRAINESKREYERQNKNYNSIETKNVTFKITQSTDNIEWNFESEKTFQKLDNFQDKKVKVMQKRSTWMHKSTKTQRMKNSPQEHTLLALFSLENLARIYSLNIHDFSPVNMFTNAYRSIFESVQNFFCDSSERLWLTCKGTQYVDAVAKAESQLDCGTQNFCQLYDDRLIFGKIITNDPGAITYRQIQYNCFEWGGSVFIPKTREDTDFILDLMETLQSGYGFTNLWYPVVRSIFTEILYWNDGIAYETGSRYKAFTFDTSSTGECYLISYDAEIGSSGTATACNTKATTNAHLCVYDLAC